MKLIIKNNKDRFINGKMVYSDELELLSEITLGNNEYIYSENTSIYLVEAIKYLIEHEDMISIPIKDDSEFGYHIEHTRKTNEYSEENLKLIKKYLENTMCCKCTIE